MANPAPGCRVAALRHSADVRISRRELVKTAEITEELLDQLENFGLVRTRAGSKHYDADALVIAKVAGELAAYGLEPRHLRAFSTAAEREVGPRRAGRLTDPAQPRGRRRGPCRPDDGRDGGALRPAARSPGEVRAALAALTVWPTSRAIVETQWAPCRLSTTTPTMISVSAAALVRSHDSPRRTTPTTAIAAVPSPAQIA